MHPILESSRSATGMTLERVAGCDMGFPVRAGDQAKKIILENAVLDDRLSMMTHFLTVIYCWNYA